MREDRKRRDSRPDRTLALVLGWISPADSPEGGPIVGLFQAVLSADAPAPLLPPCGQAFHVRTS